MGTLWTITTTANHKIEFFKISCNIFVPDTSSSLTSSSIYALLKRRGYASSPASSGMGREMSLLRALGKIIQLRTRCSHSDWNLSSLKYIWISPLIIEEYTLISLAVRELRERDATALRACGSSAIVTSWWYALVSSCPRSESLQKIFQFISLFLHYFPSHQSCFFPPSCLYLHSTMPMRAGKPCAVIWASCIRNSALAAWEGSATMTICTLRFEGD